MHHLTNLIPNNLGFAALAGGLVATLWSRLSAIPGKCVAWFMRTQTTYVQVMSDDKLFGMLRSWLAQHPAACKSRSLLAVMEPGAGGGMPGYDPDTAEQSAGIQLVFAPGNHCFVHKGCVVWLEYTRDEAKAGLSAWKEQINVRMLTRNRKRVKALLEEVCAYTESRKPERKVRISLSSGQWWESCRSTRGRFPGSVILPVGQMDELLTDAATFFDSEEWYRGAGIPWRRGYLFYGTPGSGKSSAVLALATALHTDLYVLNLGDSSLTDGSLSKLFTTTGRRSIVLIEDADTAFVGRDSKVDNKLSFGALLNAIDSAYASEGRILIMTTNHKDALDEALIRPGRIDKRFEFGYADEDQIKLLATKLSVPPVPWRPHMTMAEAQEEMLRTHVVNQCLTVNNS